MYDPKFEKGVRQKMEGLEFTPSESVWANIQKAVAGQRHRRGGFFFWRLALPATLLAGLMSVAYFAAKTGNTSPAIQSAQPAASRVKASGATGAAGAVAASAVKPDALSTAAGRAASTIPPPAAKTNEPMAFDPPMDQLPRQPRTSVSPHSVLFVENRSDRHKSAAGDHFGNGNESLDASESTNFVAPANRTAAGTTNAAASPAISPYLYQPALAGQRTTAAIKAATPSTKKAIISLGRLQKTTRPWEAGFTAGGGVSRLNRLNISAATQDQTLSANLYNIAAANAAPSKSYVSDIRPNASFTAGIYLQKPLSRRWSVNLGMSLHYYSTRITIGQQVNTYVPAAASFIVPTVSAAAQTSTAFIAGDRQVFNNHYYFLELPVNIQFQLNKSHLLPLFLESGVSLSRLMGSDALFYNAHSGVYYKDPGVLEKTQFNVSSALMVGLPFHGIRIMAGPQVQYGLTPLVDNHAQGDQHFIYAGLRVVVIPGRK